MYTLSLELVEFLLSGPARKALDALAHSELGDAHTLARLMELRQSFRPEEAAVLLDQARLRQQGSAKFVSADASYYTDEALQQASSLLVARYRAHYFAAYQRVADLGCGIGADTIALAAVVPAVLAVELDPVRAALARENVAAAGLAERVTVLCADWTSQTLDVEAAFIDPARRVQGRRVFRLDQMQPSLAAIGRLRDALPHVLVKVAPGVDYAEIPHEAELEFISEHGTLKEALLLFGDFRSGTHRRATLLPGPYQLDSNVAEPDVLEHEPQEYIYEPDAAIIRAGLVRQLAGQIGAMQLDAQIAYLSSNRLVRSPFARAWQTIRHGPFGLKELNVWLRDLNAGEVIIKKRGSPIEPDAFQRKLKTTVHGRRLTVFLTRVKDSPWMVVGTDISAP